MLPSLGLPAFSNGATMMSMPQAAPSAYPGLQGLWGPVAQPPPAGELIPLSALLRLSSMKGLYAVHFHAYEVSRSIT